MSIRTVGLGAGGHAKVVIDILRHYSDHEIFCLLDPNPDLHATFLYNIPILGDDTLLPSLGGHGVTHFFVGMGGATRLFPRSQLFDKGLATNLMPVTAVHPTAVIASSVTLGKGVTIMATAVINADTYVGDNVIVNTGAIVEHDCTIEDHVHIAPGAVLSGGVQIGAQTLVGVGAVVRQGIKIGHHVLIGAGSVVVKDVADDQIVMGNPARLRGNSF